jgi:tRNA nucleotidyltransferase (CCA-adding enzyme)
VAELEKLRETQMQLQMQGIHADPSAAQFPLLTAKMAPKDISGLKRGFPRKGFVAEIDALEGEAKKFAAELGSKAAATASGAWKMLMAARPQVVLWVAYSTKSAPLQAKFKSFYTEWPQARQKVPYVLMQEMRIVPELAGFDELVEKLVFELMDGKLGTVEEMKAFLEPYSPPAPPPPVSLRRARAAKKEAKVPKSRKKAEAAADGQAEAALAADVVAALGKGGLEEHMGRGAAGKAAVKAGAAVKTAAPGKTAAKAAPAKAVLVKAVPAKTVQAKKVIAKVVVKKPVVVKKVAPVKKAVAKKAAPAKKAAKVVAKKAPAKKAAAKKPVKTVAKKAPAKKAAKPAAKKPAKVAAKKKKR